ncbi:recombinase family protein [Peribacillus simplex]|uniref:recombinase family protein n=1 Tax=Peribacillus simplex TaxID=1478 RepID=UPI003BA389C7
MTDYPPLKDAAPKAGWRMRFKGKSLPAWLGLFCLCKRIYPSGLEMLRLLKDVEQDLYDAVLVVDLDRLIRGDLEDMGRLSRIFRDSNTVGITPTDKVYNFNDDDQSLINNFEMVFANHEYKVIKKRMLRGKKQGAKAGKWTNGTPPYPYVYNRITRELDIETKKAKIYNLMKKMFIEDMKPAHEIAWELNKLGIKTSKNADWHENSIRRV